MLTVTPTQLEALRAHRYHRTPARRVQTKRQAERFVNELGLCFFWPITGVEFPSLFHAIAGRVRAVPMAHDDPDLSKCWSWKDQALGRRQWYYAKLLRKKATLVALEELPYCYALSPNYGGDDDYLNEYEAGQLSREAKTIFEALLHHGALDTLRLRREARLAADSAKTVFERALTELQTGMKILPVGIAEAGSWRYAFIYDLVTRHFPQLSAQARDIGRAAARLRLAARMLDNVIAASPAQIAQVFHVFKWTPLELRQTLADLQAQKLALPATLKGREGELLVSARYFKA